MAFAHLTKQDITVELAEDVLGTTTQSRKESVDLKSIIKALGKYYPYSLDELRSKQRNKDLAFVRQMAMYIMKKTTDKSLRDIGSYLGSRNHATVKHALSKIEQMALKNSKLHKQIELIIKECK
jgi:chromosomal replication initiator protein